MKQPLFVNALEKSISQPPSRRGKIKIELSGCHLEGNSARPIAFEDQCSILNYTALHRQWRLIDSSDVNGGEVTGRLDLPLNAQFQIKLFIR